MQACVMGITLGHKTFRDVYIMVLASNISESETQEDRYFFFLLNILLLCLPFFWPIHLCRRKVIFVVNQLYIVKFILKSSASTWLSLAAE